ncbi:MAG: hypothetical protein H0T60_03165 [Acidobacteria bacterium]|nr:hypothetical protein [Acidobacteriota bacterium]
MIMITVELDINGHKQIIPHAVQIEVDEIGGLPFGEARRYVDNKVKEFVSEAVSYTWTVEKLARPTRATEQVAA